MRLNLKYGFRLEFATQTTWLNHQLPATYFKVQLALTYLIFVVTTHICYVTVHKRQIKQFPHKQSHAHLQLGSAALPQWINE